MRTQVEVTKEKPTVEFEVRSERVEEICKTFQEAKVAAKSLYSISDYITIVKSDESDVVAIWDLVGGKLVRVE
jgi:cobalamin biosynthesis Co2+ chelatase CbiK